MIRRARAVAVLALAIAAAGCALPERTFRRSPAGTALPGEGTVLPSRWAQGYAFVETSVDGRGPFLFLLDTGSSTVAVSSRVAGGHGGEKGSFEPGTRGQGAGGVQFDVENAIAIRSLRSGSVEFAGVDALVLDLAPLGAVFGMEVDGVLGWPAFADVLLVLDAPAGEVRVVKGELPAPDGAEILALGDWDLPTVVLRFGSEEVSVVLDSGCRSGIVLDDRPESVPLEAGPVPGRRSLTIGGIMRRSTVVRLSGVATLGRHRFPAPVVHLQPGMHALGIAVLGEFRVTLDALHRRVRFERAGDGPIPTKADASTGAGILPEGDLWFVRDVIPGSPAEKAGVRVGDRVLEVNGVPVAELDREFLWTIVALEGVTIRLTLERDGQRLEFALPVVSLLP